jgi:hypothetical protein
MHVSSILQKYKFQPFSTNINFLFKRCKRHPLSLAHILLALSYIDIVGTPLSRYRGRRIKSWLMDKVIGFRVSFLLAQANGWACTNFGCNHPIDGLF